MGDELLQAEKDAMLASQDAAIADAESAAQTDIVADLQAVRADTAAKPVAPPPATGDESPQGTTCHRNSGAVRIGGHDWSINDVNYLRLDGGAIPTGWQCANGITPAELVIWNHVLWGNNANAPAQWQTINHSNGSLGPITTDPRGAAPPIEPPIDPPPQPSDYDPADYLTITDDASLSKKRAELVNYIWPGGIVYLWSRSRRASARGMPTARPTITQNVAPPFPVTAAKRCDQWRTDLLYAGSAMRTFGYCYRPKGTPDGKFALLMPGHNNSLSARNFDALTQDLCARGTTVCIQGMVLFAGNYSEAGFGNHDQMAVLNSAAPYMDHCLITVNQAAAEGFGRIGALGLSGGAQQLCVLGAVDARIRLLYTVSGWKPLALWQGGNSPVTGGDWEQWNSLGQSFSVCSYEDLATMGGAGDHVQGCNVLDPYFPGTDDDLYAAELNRRASALGGRFRIHRYSYPDHTLDESVRAAFMGDL